MSKKPDTASALAGILKARRSEELVSEVGAPAEAAPVIEEVANPSPALPVTPSVTAISPAKTVSRGRIGKNSDKLNFSQHSIYLKKGTHKAVKRALEDSGSSADFSEFVQTLLEKWLASHT